MVVAAEKISNPQSRRRFLRSGLHGFRAEFNGQKSLLTDQKKRIPADLFTATRFADPRGIGTAKKSVQSVESVVRLVPPIPMPSIHKPRSGLNLGGENSELLPDMPILRHRDLGSCLDIDHCPLVIERSADPSGHNTQPPPPPPQQPYHPPQHASAASTKAHPTQTSPSNTKGANGHAGKGTSGNSESHIVHQINAQNTVPDWAVPKPGEPLAGPASTANNQNSTGYTPTQLAIIHAHLERIFHGGPAMQYASYNKNPVYDGWIAQAQAAQRGSTPGGSPFAPTQDQQNIAQVPTMNIGGVSVPTDIAQNSQTAFNAKQAAVEQAIAAGDFQKANYLMDREFDIPNLSTPHVKLPPGASLIPGLKNLAQIHADWLTGHYSKATQSLKFGIAAMGVAVITGALARELDITPGSMRGLAQKMGIGQKSPLRAGDVGSFSELEGQATVGDILTPHHMPQAALGFTSRGEGGAIMLPQSMHTLTRTYGFGGARLATEEASTPFRTVLSRDIRDLRNIPGIGNKYNQSVRDLLGYYRKNFPKLITRTK